MISLFTLPGWFGNHFLDGEYRVGDSDFAEIAAGSVTKTTFVRAESEAKRALQWMIDDGLASEISVQCANRSGIGVDCIVGIKAPSGTLDEIKLRRYGGNWIRQYEDPANARLSDGEV